MLAVRLWRLRFVSILSAVMLAALAGACGRDDDGSGLESADGGLVYVAGTRAAPPLRAPGPGAGAWNSTPWTMTLWSEAQAIRAYLATDFARQKYGREACEAFSHYFDNTGLIWTFDAGKLGQDVPHVGAVMDREIARAAEFAREIAREITGANNGRTVTEFTSREALPGRVERAQSLNWYLAVADFSYYVTGRVERDACGHGCARAEIIFHVWDRYDWDPGPIVRIHTPAGPVDVDQDHVGEFHRQGIAKEFTSLGFKRFNFELRDLERTTGLEPATSSLGS